ncbi:tRNA pseudouridine(38-40) synthase TruA [Undibacterium sp.]|uniref:tRNA pseudouridine(38-40) synthase TruA n=1 Tax=Undibacterium sp. TaxID=1914977 RepID=UPI00375363AB
MTLNRIILGVEYQGANYQGWQTQPNGNTVQDILESALTKFARSSIHTMCAGRTDAGVHALEQIVHFDTILQREMYSWVNGVNAFLPPNIALRWAKQISVDAQDQNGFHARFSAYSRTYHYLLHNAKVRSPLWASRAGWFFRPLDLDLMQQGASHLIGEHDFTVFRAAGCQAKSPIKHMYEVKIRQQDDLIVFTLRANAFLHHMVRNIVGALIFVGMQKRDPDWIQILMESKDRSLSAPTFMPDGLYLAKIGYDKKWDLPNTDGENLPYGISF